MPAKDHHYSVTVTWTGNTGTGTEAYRSFERAHDLAQPGKPTIEGSADPSFLGDPAKWNPEELLVASLSACHKLWYLGLCSNAGIVVTSYEDAAEGHMVEEAKGGGQFSSVTLRPKVTISSVSDEKKAVALHEKAHELCFIARSTNFPVHCNPTIVRND